MAASSTAIYSGMSAPLTIDNQNNHSGSIVIITSLNLVLILSSLAARIFASYQRRIVQKDDYMFGVLVLVASLQACVVLVQVHCGWGTRMEAVTAMDERMLKAAYAADILSILVSGLSKITTCLFYEALFSQIRRWFIRAILLVIVAWIIAAILLLAVRCHNDPWNDISAAHCRNLLPRWEAITSLDIFTEVLLLLYAGLAIYKVKISVSKKLMVLLGLESRVVLIPLAALRFYFTKKQIESEYPILTGAFATITTEIYLALGVVCLVSAFLKSFLAAYEDQNGISYTDGTSTSRLKSSKRGSSNTFPRKYLPPSSSGTNSTNPLRSYEQEDDPTTSHAHSGQGLQIMKTVQLEVQDEAVELTDCGTVIAGDCRNETRQNQHV